MNFQIGFMQGRLCNLVDQQIQAFPWDDWESEFAAAKEIDLHLMEWTLDQEHLYKNPLLTLAGQEKIQRLCKRHALSIHSMTGDCFMQEPFWKVSGKARTNLQSDFLRIGRACSSVGIKVLVVPLVDNGRLETRMQEDDLIDFFMAQRPFLNEHGLRVTFESDFAPSEVARFIKRLSPKYFGINYDIGNSASLGFKPADEFAAYGERITNVHVKDRMFAGTTVPLKTGSADFDAVFLGLAHYGYRGNFILQTARAVCGDHSKILFCYAKMTKGWIQKYGLGSSK